MKLENVEPSTSAIVERYGSVLYPFPIERVLDVLPEQGWIVPLVERDEGGVKLSGAVTKGSVKLVFDPSLKTFGVRGVDPAEALSEFRAVSDFVIAKFGLGPEVHSYFTEFRFTGTVDVGTAPKATVPEQLDRWWAGHERSEALAGKLTKWLPGDPIAVYGIRVATKGKDANRPNWCELTMGPSPTSGHRLYNFDLLYRNEDRGFVESVAEKAKELVASAVEELER